MDDLPESKSDAAVLAGEDLERAPVGEARALRAEQGERSAAVPEGGPDHGGEGAAAVIPFGAVKGKCRACDAPMLWAVTAAGKRMPLDPRPAPNGNVFFRADGRVGVVGSAALRRMRAAEAGALAGDMYVAHFATCSERARPKPGNEIDRCLVTNQTPTGLSYSPSMQGAPCEHAATTRLEDGTPSCDAHAHAAEIADDVEVDAVPDPRRFVDPGEV